ncbi:MAG: phosphodiester glycosidase family protein [Mycoplasmatota bacterium]
MEEIEILDIDGFDDNKKETTEEYVVKKKRVLKKIKFKKTKKNNKKESKKTTDSKSSAKKDTKKTIESKKESKKTIKKAKKKDKKKKKLKLITKILFILDLGALACLFVAYGPFYELQSLFVTSSLETMTHKYLARTIYSQETLDDFLANNTIIEVEGNTDASSITFIDITEQETYLSIYEEQILKKDEDNDLYKVIEISGDDYVGKIIVVYDPSRLDLVTSEYINYGGQQLDSLIESYGGVAGINASGFSIYSSGALNIVGTIIDDGVLIQDGNVSGFEGGIIGFNEDNVLILTKKSGQEAIDEDNIVDAINFGPFLIVNGETSTFVGNGGYGLASRTAIGQRQDGIVLLVVIDGRQVGYSLGVDMVELTDIMLKYGCYNASNLDGGGSSTLYANGEVLSSPGGYGYSGNRYLPNAWVLK